MKSVVPFSVVPFVVSVVPFVPPSPESTPLFRISVVPFFLLGIVPFGVIPLIPSSPNTCLFRTTSVVPLSNSVVPLSNSVVPFSNGRIHPL